MSRGFYISIGIIFGIVIIGAVVFSVSTKNQKIFQGDTKEACTVTGGVWKQFGNGCADLCGSEGQDTCTMMVIESCDCGTNQCWNGKRCQ